MADHYAMNLHAKAILAAYETKDWYNVQYKLQELMRVASNHRYFSSEILEYINRLSPELIYLFAILIAGVTE